MLWQLLNVFNYFFFRPCFEVFCSSGFAFFHVFFLLITSSLLYFHSSICSSVPQKSVIFVTVHVKMSSIHTCISKLYVCKFCSKFATLHLIEVIQCDQSSVQIKRVILLLASDIQRDCSCDRSRRRRAREMHNIVNHHEGLSSDDEESQADVTKFSMEQGGRLSVLCTYSPGNTFVSFSRLTGCTASVFTKVKVFL